MSKMKLSEMVIASSACNIKSEGCNCIDVKILSDKIEKLNKSIEAGDAKTKAEASEKINIYRTVIEGIESGNKPIDMIDANDLEALAASVCIKYEQLIDEGKTEVEALDYFFSKDVRKESEKFSLARYIYTRDEIKQILTDLQNSASTESVSFNCFPEVFFEGVQKLNDSKIQESYEALRADMNEQWKTFSSMQRRLKEVTDANVEARQTNAAKPSDDAVSKLNTFVDEVVAKDSFLTSSDNWEAVSYMLKYPSLTNALSYKKNASMDNKRFDSRVLLVAKNLQISDARYVGHMLVCIAPYFGVSIPEESKFKYGAYNNSNSDTDGNSSDYGGDKRTNNRYEEPQELYDKAEQELEDLWDELISNYKIAEDLTQLCNSQIINPIEMDLKSLKARYILYAAGYERVDEFIAHLTRLNEIIEEIAEPNRLPKFRKFNAMYDNSYLKTFGVTTASDMFIRRAAGLNRIIRVKTYEYIALIVWALAMIAGLVVSIF